MFGLAALAIASVVAPGGFSAEITNPYLPLRPGSTWRFRGSDEGERTTEIVTVTRQVKVIQGAPCVVLRDRAFSEGKLSEETTDWYSQASDGTVWYFGEATRTVDSKGRTVSREGSWQAGVNGARPGIFMPAKPRVGAIHRQEIYRGHAEDKFRIDSLNGSVTVPYKRFRGNLLVTHEWTRLEPGVRDRKYYARGIGVVREESIRGGNETNSLVSFSRGR